jgi:hypothetical protein
MGQGYRAVILASEQKPELIRTWVDSHCYGNGYKLMEHSYIGNDYVQALEYLISPLGMFYKSRVVWAGDYADPETGSDKNLNAFTLDDDIEAKMSRPSRYDMSPYRYIVNHTLKLYVDKNYGEEGGWRIHPLSLLTAEGNGRGGGDYSGSNEELVGTWARNVISVEKEAPDGYTELVCEFSR